MSKKSSKQIWASFRAVLRVIHLFFDMKAFAKVKLELSVKTLLGVVPTPSVCHGYALLVALLGFHFPKVDTPKPYIPFVVFREECLCLFHLRDQ